MFQPCSRALRVANGRRTSLARSFGSPTNSDEGRIHFFDVSDGILRIHLTNECNAASFISTRGPGFRLPASQKFNPLPNGFGPSVDNIVEAVEKAYEEGQKAPNDIVFDNILGEPTLKMQNLLEAAGRNAADDVTYSGTVGAAMEGFLFGVPSIFHYKLSFIIIMLDCQNIFLPLMKTGNWSVHP